MPADIPFGFGPSGGDVPDPNDPRQMQQFLSQLQHLFATPGGGPVNWDLARQVAQGHLTGGPEATGPGPTIGFTAPMITPSAAFPAPGSGPVGDPAIDPAERTAVDDA